MKKTTLFMLSCVMGFTVIAQNQMSMGSGSTMGKKLGWGVDAGVNLSKFDLDRGEFADPSLTPDVKAKTSFHLGAFLDIPLGGMLSLKPSLMYSRQGSEVMERASAGENGTKYEEDLAYLLVAPASLHVMTKPGFIFETGPMLGYLVGAEQDGPAPYNNDNMRDQRNKIDLLWSAGVGFLTKVGVGVHARYNYGFSNVLNNSGNAQPIGEYHNRVIQLGLMYHFGHAANK